MVWNMSKVSIWMTKEIFIMESGNLVLSMEGVPWKLLNQFISEFLLIGSSMGQDKNILQMEIFIGVNTKMDGLMGLAPMNGKIKEQFIKVILKMV